MQSADVAWRGCFLSCSETFVYEYVGEVIGPAPFARKMKEYANEGIKHFYFMALDKEVVRFFFFLLLSRPLISPLACWDIVAGRKN